jgi:DNA polymerase/3'-5' exonuclease PolX
MTRVEVMPYAQMVHDLLRPACLDIEIAGSVRRGKPDVHDLEFVLIPHRDEDLFGSETVTYSMLDSAIAAAVSAGRLVWDSDVKRNGPKLKRLKHPRIGLIVELYIADQENFGNLLTIRTGHADFSRWIMTSRAQGGAMPIGRRQQGGYLWDVSSPSQHRLIPCRTEADYFREVGVLKSMPPPERRTAELAAQLWQGRA